MEKIKSALAVLWLSVVRTVSPYIVGGVLGFFTTRNITIDPELESALTITVSVGFGAVYYLIVRLLEVYVAPKFGVLLGSLKSPDTYSAKPTADVVERKANKHIAS